MDKFTFIHLVITKTVVKNVSCLRMQRDVTFSSLLSKRFIKSLVRQLLMAFFQRSSQLPVNVVAGEPLWRGLSTSGSAFKARSNVLLK